MGIFEWGAVAALIALGTVVWRLAAVIQRTADKASAAEALAANASAKTATLEQDLSAHKEHVASEYMSRRELTDALNRIVDRIDTLVFHFLPKTPPQ